MPALGRVDYNIYTVALEKAVPPVPLKLPTVFFIEATNSEHSKERKKAMELELKCIRDYEAAVITPIADVPRKKKSPGYKICLQRSSW